MDLSHSRHFDFINDGSVPSSVPVSHDSDAQFQDPGIGTPKWNTAITFDCFCQNVCCEEDLLTLMAALSLHHTQAISELCLAQGFVFHTTA